MDGLIMCMYVLKLSWWDTFPEAVVLVQYTRPQTHAAFIKQSHQAGVALHPFVWVSAVYSTVISPHSRCSPVCRIYFTLSLWIDSSVSPLLQHLWHSALVSSSLPASPSKDGSRPGRAHGQVPLVRRLVPSPLLFAPALTGARPLAGGLAGDGWCWGSFSGSDHLCSYCKCDADSQPWSPAR